jgi:hypothetical protein
MADDPTRNRDHVPPNAIFAKQDRNHPLILPTHERCNQMESQSDEVIGQIVSLCHGRAPREDRLRFKPNVVRVDNRAIGCIRGVQLEKTVWRWVRGFHAALYGEYVPSDRGGHIMLPMPRLDRGNDDNDRARLSEAVKRNRCAGSVDRIVIRNGKCVYECFWDHLDDGRCMCVFALRLYDWEKLGLQTGTRRGCVGYYCPGGRAPADGSQTTELVFPTCNRSPLDPFADEETYVEKSASRV